MHFMVAILISATAPCLGGAVYDSLADFPKSMTADYDYIIVGGGTAGSTVAHRLAEDNETSVLVIEAGGMHTESLNLKVPAWYAREFNTHLDWNYTSVPQPGLNNRTLPYPRGHVLGGSSCFSGMAITRGGTENWDRIAEVTGDKGWSWESLLPYMFKNEKLLSPMDHHNTTGQVIPSVHGHDGLVGVTPPSYPSPLDIKVVNTAKEFKEEFPYTQDMNSGNEIGIGFQLSTIRNGVHENSATAYLGPGFIKAHKIDVLLNTRVTRMVPDASYPGHKGLQFRTVEAANDKLPSYPNRINLTVRREIILSSGAINTPQLLLLSGVGDSKDLATLNLTTVLHNPFVGAHLADHPGVTLSWFVNETFSNDTAAALAEWKEKKTGPLTITNTNMRGHFRFSRRVAEEYKKRFGKDTPGGKDSAHYEIVLLYNSASTTRATFGMFVTLLNTQSYGTIKLNTTNPFDPPLINPSFLAKEEDVFVLREGVRAALRFIQGKAWTGYLLDPVAPQPEFDTTDGDIDAWIRTNAASMRHPLGSAAMTKVVDSELRLKGAKGIRVVDASVFPLVPSAHTMTPVYIIAEKAAALIMKDWDREN
ncbi:aryl-alcohol oxidase [Moniliophthora roreri MCA 2997]|uniref:Aryl-alcohol oxidase n=1 Tax=Moniliophthora roreri (strain MCA 2997) TaxID=1381753 RepID=V2YG59_MONRO|nr:aryl-alcohol oxidase [Moniliophthora roreri MCA 2997]